jgi:general secretion pathway protein G
MGFVQDCAGTSGRPAAGMGCCDDHEPDGLRSPAARRAGRRARHAGFTLIEIMAVVLIIGLLTAIVGTAIFGQIDRARATTAKTQIKQLEAALDFYRMDNGRYPTTDQGLDALVHQPTIEPIPRQYRPEGYLQGGAVPLDPWGQPYEYQSPGTHNTYSFDLWSYGADGHPGGTGVDSDIGNWAEDQSS